MDIEVRHLISRKGVFYFQVRVPRDLRGLLQRDLIKRSLKTRNAREAMKLAERISDNLNRMFATLRGNPMSKSEIDKAIQAYFNNILNDVKASHLRQVYSTPESKLAALDAVADRMADISLSAKHNDLHEAKDIVDGIISKYKLSIQPDSDEYWMLCQDILFYSHRLADIESQMIRGDFSKTLSDLFAPAQETPSAPAPPNTRISTVSESDKGLPISEVFNKFLEEKDRSDAWDAAGKNKSTHVMLLNLLLEVFGDVGIKTIDHHSLMEFRNNILTRLPSNRNKSPRFKGKDYHTILKMTNVTPMSRTTVNNHLSKIGAFFKWATLHGYIDRNCAEGLSFPKSTKASEERAIYDRDDIMKICEELELLPPTYPYRYWIPLIALFSGMRQTEIAQLYLSDVQDVDGILCFKIDDSRPDQNLKSKAAHRIVPIHSTLSQLGFLDYLESLRKNKAERLWPTLRGGRDGYGQVFQRWYGRFNRKKITDDTKKVFHSFRHTFTNEMKQNGISELIISELVGHHNDSMTMGRYGKSYAPKHLLEAMSRVKFDEAVQCLTPWLKKKEH